MFIQKGRTLLKVSLKPSFAFQTRLFQITTRHFNNITNDERQKLIDFKEPVDSDQLKLKKFVLNRSNHVNRYQEYRNIPLESKKQKIETYDAFGNFTDIVANNEETPPAVGSFIEFIDPVTNKSSFGVVLRESNRIFNEAYNTVTVLNVNNELRQIYPTFIKMHLLKVLRSSWVESLNILENRLDENSENRIIMVKALKEFLSESLYISDALNSQFEIVYSQRAQPYHINPISLAEIIEDMDLRNIELKRLRESYYYQSCLIFSCHLNFTTSYRWVVSNAPFLNKITNISKNDCSNQLISPYQYFSNSIHNTESIDEFLSSTKNEEGVSRINKFLSSLIEEQNSLNPKSLDELNLYFNIWEGRQFKYIIDVLKFTIIYPHFSIVDGLSKLEIFINGKVSPGIIYSLLEEMKIYDNEMSQMSDIILSANLAGQPSLSQISISSLSEIEDNKEYTETIELGTLKDKFNHLRKSKTYFQDHVIYGIPYLEGPDPEKDDKTLAISLEKINSRKYMINVHIPDIVSKLSPSSPIFDRINNSGLNMRSLSNFINGSSKCLFEDSLITKNSFQNQNIEESDNWYRVGDLVKQKRSAPINSNVTCMTISFIYNMYEANPFSDLNGKIRVSFDSLTSVKVKNLNWKSLEESLNRNEESPFRLFTRRRGSNLNSESESIKLIEEDHHNIKFIYNIMKSHFKLRNLEGAAIDESFNRPIDDSSNMWKELSILDDKDNERICTKIFTNSEHQKKTAKSRFFINEIDMFVSNLTANYCSDQKIPVVNICQDLLDNLRDEPEESLKSKTVEDDEVLVSHNNMFLPNFHASSYFHTLLSKDANGYISREALIIGKGYLSKKRIESSLYENTRNLPLGLKNGYIPICDVFNDYRSILNQLQLLLHLHFSHSVKERNFRLQTKRYSYLKRYGYNLHGCLSSEILSQELLKIQNAEVVKSFLSLNNKYYWTLKMLEQRLLEKEFSMADVSSAVIYECTITSNKYYIPELQKTILRAYCKNLDIEVDIITSKEDEKAIGSKIECNKVIHLDPANCECILEERLLL